MHLQARKFKKTYVCKLPTGLHHVFQSQVRSDIRLVVTLLYLAGRILIGGILWARVHGAVCALRHAGGLYIGAYLLQRP